MVGLLRALSRSLFSRIYSNPHSAVIRVSQGSRSLYSTLQFSDCGEINKNHIGKEIQLRGWVQSHRPLGGLLFILLRDYTGTVQLVWSPEKTADNSTDPEGNIKVATSDYSLESIIQVKGRVRSRPESMINPKMVNGDVEVLVLEQKLINKSDILPYVLFGANNITEETRLKYRYLDLRRPEVQKNILLRSRVSHLIRSHLVDEGFAEIETPTLTKSTPEGAREFLVATRSPGHFYALPQSPQQYKQLLMASGFQKYFQIARCYRDEGNRADRQPEFTQVDLEMAFVSDRDVMNCMENLIRRIWKATVFSKVCDAEFEKKVQFPILSYMQAIRSYGSDKPDTRYDICIRDITSTSKSTTFSPFLEAIEAMGTVKSVCIPKLGKIMSNAQVKELIDEAKKLKEGTKGHIFTAKVEPGARLKSSMTKFIPEAIQREICLQHEAKDEDVIFFTCGSEIPACITLGRIRLLAANILRKHELLLVPKDTYNFLWVTDFPLFEVDDDRVLDDGKHPLRSMHHPFTSPHPEDIIKLESNPLEVRGLHFDLVLNGVELGGGSIRVHDAKLQQDIFDRFLRLPSNGREFTHLLNALRSGCPPHGGMALGFDRLMLMICNQGESTGSIRDVIAFPKTSGGADLLFGSPALATDNQLKEVGLAVEKS